MARPPHRSTPACPDRPVHRRRRRAPAAWTRPSTVPARPARAFLRHPVRGRLRRRPTSPTASSCAARRCGLVLPDDCVHLRPDCGLAPRGRPRARAQRAPRRTRRSRASGPATAAGCATSWSTAASATILATGPDGRSAAWPSPRRCAPRSTWGACSRPPTSSSHGMDTMLGLGAFTHDSCSARSRGSTANVASSSSASWRRWPTAGRSRSARPRCACGGTAPVCRDRRPRSRSWSTAGRSARLDMGLEDCCFGAEYDGEQWHGDDQYRARRGAPASGSTRERGWTIEVFRKAARLRPAAGRRAPAARCAYDACARALGLPPDVLHLTANWRRLGLQTGAGSAQVSGARRRRLLTSPPTTISDRDQEHHGADDVDLHRDAALGDTPDVHRERRGAGRR